MLIYTFLTRFTALNTLMLYLNVQKLICVNIINYHIPKFFVQPGLPTVPILVGHL